MWRSSFVSGRPCSEAGSAVIEFLLVSVLLVGLTAGVLQLALFLHVRNTLTDAAAEGARQGALVGESAASGARRARDLIEVAVGNALDVSVESQRGMWQGQATMTVVVTAPLPVFGFLGPSGGLRAVARTPVEVLAHS